jgi:hypothetical protein
VRGVEPDQVDFNASEILVSKDDVRDHRQLIWEGFAGNRARDEYSTYLFFYDAVDSPADKSLLALFERYFEQLPLYKTCLRSCAGFSTPNFARAKASGGRSSDVNRRVRRIVSATHARSHGRKHSQSTADNASGGPCASC